MLYTFKNKLRFYYLKCLVPFFKKGQFVHPKKLTKKDWKHSDSLLGGRTPREILFPENFIIDKYLPEPDNQAIVGFNGWGCVSYTKTSILEMIFIRMMELDPGVTEILDKLGILIDGKPKVSPRALAVMSGTIPGRGNSMQNVAKTAYKRGIVGEKWCPTLQGMSEADYYNLPADVEKMAKESLKYFDFLYEAADQRISDIVKYSPVQVAVNGAYDYNDDGLIGYFGAYYNHSTTHRGYLNGIPNIYDSFPPYLIKFVSNYIFGYPYLHYVKKKSNLMKLVKEIGKPAVYLYITELDKYFAIADTEIDGAIIGGGDWFKVFCGTYGNAHIEKVESIDKSKLAGDIKPDKY